MNSLTRWNPYREMMDLQRQMDRFFSDSSLPSLFSGTFGQRSLGGDLPRIWGLDLDVSETEEAFVVRASVPGFDPDELDITLTDNVLTISGTLEQKHQEDDEVYHLRERRTGSFSRSLTLPTGLDADNVEASCENGLLTVRVPKAEESRPRRIPISGSQKPIEDRDTIEGTLTD